MNRKTQHPRINFTHTALDHLKAPEGTKQGFAYYDIKEPKLMVIVYPGGTKTFSVSKKVNGRASKYKLGNYPEMTVEQARKQAKVILGRIARGEDPQDDKRRYRKEMRLDEFFAAYCADAKKSTIEDDRKTYRLYLSDWRTKKLSDIKRSDVREKLTHLTKTKSEHISNKVHTLIRRLFNVAIDMEAHLGANPAKGMQRNPSRSRDRYLEEHELPFLFEALTYEANPIARAFFKVLLLTGMRKSEVLTLKRQNIDWHRNELHLPKTKNGEAHTLPMSQQLREVLQEIQGVGQWVFLGNSAQGHLNEPRKAWVRLLQRARLLQMIHIYCKYCDVTGLHGNAYKHTPHPEIDGMIRLLKMEAESAGADVSRTGIPNIRIHDLRRTFGSYQAIAGTNLHIISKTLNHKSPATTAIYARLSDSPVRASVERVATTMMNMLPPA